MTTKTKQNSTSQTKKDIMNSKNNHTTLYKHLYKFFKMKLTSYPKINTKKMNLIKNEGEALKKKSNPRQQYQYQLHNKS